MNALIACTSCHLVTKQCTVMCICSDMGLKNKAWQVVDLVESRNNLIQENHQLVENISSLELQIEDFKNISIHPLDELTKVCFLNLLIKWFNVVCVMYFSKIVFGTSI